MRRLQRRTSAGSGSTPRSLASMRRMCRSFIASAVRRAMTPRRPRRPRRTPPPRGRAPWRSPDRDRSGSAPCCASLRMRAPDQRVTARQEGDPGAGGVRRRRSLAPDVRCPRGGAAPLTQRTPRTAAQRLLAAGPPAADRCAARPPCRIAAWHARGRTALAPAAPARVDPAFPPGLDASPDHLVAAGCRVPDLDEAGDGGDGDEHEQDPQHGHEDDGAQERDAQRNMRSARSMRPPLAERPSDSAFARS